MIIILLINQPDLGQTILLVTTWVSIVFISGVKISYILLLFAFLIICFVSLLVIFPEKLGYISQRFSTFFDPTKGDNFQTDKALEAIKQGG